jgi:geranylgeranyl diphosphate synthase type I
MLSDIKNRVEEELKRFAPSLKKEYRLGSCPLLLRKISEYICRPGKRIRPVLFVFAYLAYKRKPAPRLYRSSLAIEFFHDFMLIHDDIIDKSRLRRGKPAMHTMFTKLLRKKNAKFSGEDLAIVTGDILYSIAIDTFLSVKENMNNKERAISLLLKAGASTGCGEFSELLLSTKRLKNTCRSDIYQVYDLKTANYTFATPLAMGAALAGQPEKQINILKEYGIYLGRAFQIKDDILGIFGNQSEIGKPIVSDLKEGKKTILIWQAYKNSAYSKRMLLENILKKKDAGLKQLDIIRRLIRNSGGLYFAENEIARLAVKASSLLKHSSLPEKYRSCLDSYAKSLLALKPSSGVACARTIYGDP